MIRSKIKLAGFLLGAALSVLMATASVAQSYEALMEARRAGMQAFSDGDPEEAYGHFERANDVWSRHPVVVFNLAALAVELRRPVDALAWLERYAAMGLAVNLGGDGAFSGIREVAGFARVEEAINHNLEPISNSEQVVVATERLRITEGIAYDKASDTFLLSSVGGRRIIRFDQEGGALAVPDVLSDLDLGPMGMAFDRSGDGGVELLYITMAGLPEAVGQESPLLGHSALIAYEPVSKEIVERLDVDMTDGAKHILGDLAIADDGAVYVTDSASPRIYWRDPNTGALEVFVESKDFINLQGPAVSADSRYLYVSDYSIGIHLVDLETRAVSRLGGEHATTLIGIDGLYVIGHKLIAVQNGTNPQRILAIDLVEPGRIGSIRVVEANNPAFHEPTLGVVAGDSFYYVANSHWPLFGGNGAPAEVIQAEWRPPEIWRLNIKDLEKQ